MIRQPRDNLSTVVAQQRFFLLRPLFAGAPRRPIFKRGGVLKDLTNAGHFAARIRDTINLVIREHRNHPCAVSNCPCMVHRLGLPQADEIASMLQAVRDAKAARR